MSKENTFTLPFAIVLVEWIGWGFSKQRIGKRLLMVAPFFLVVATMPDFCVIRILTHDPAPWLPGARDLEELTITRTDYFLTQFRVICTYLRLLVLPVNQMVDYDYPIGRSFFSPPTLAAFSFLSGILVAGFYFLKRQRLLSLGIFLFFLSLSIESSIFPIKDVIFEHRMYLPMASAALFLSYGSFILFKKKKQYLAVCSVVILVLSVTAFTRNAAWRSEISLWKDNIKKSPHKARPLNNLGFAYFDKGMGDNASKCFKRSLEVDPSNADAYSGLALYAASRNDFGKAKEYYKKAIEKAPGLIAAYYNLGNIYANLGEMAEARKMFEKAIEIAPDYIPAINNLGVLCFREGLIREAESYFKQAIEKDPGYVSAYYDLGVLYGHEKQWDLAVEEYQKVLKLDGSNTSAVFNLGMALFHLKNIQGMDRQIDELRRLGQDPLAERLEKVRDGKIMPEMKKDFVKCESWDEPCFEQFEEGQRDSQKVIALGQEIQEIVRMNQAVRTYAH